MAKTGEEILHPAVHRLAMSCSSEHWACLLPYHGLCQRRCVQKDASLGSVSPNQIGNPSLEIHRQSFSKSFASLQYKFLFGISFWQKFWIDDLKLEKCVFFRGFWIAHKNSHYLDVITISCFTCSCYHSSHHNDTDISRITCTMLMRKIHGDGVGKSFKTLKEVHIRISCITWNVAGPNSLVLIQVTLLLRY